MSELPPDFKDFLKLLNEHQVEYLLIGGYAVSYFGYPRPTGDIDFWIAVNPRNIDRILQVLSAFGFGNTRATPASFLKPGAIIRMGMPPNRIELATAISGVSFQDCYTRKISTTLDGIPVSVICMHDLKINKKASGRPKDLADLEQLP